MFPPPFPPPFHPFFSKCYNKEADQVVNHQSAALLNAIKDYETNKWKVIGQKVGKPAKVSQGLLYLIVVWLFETDTDAKGLRTIRQRALCWSDVG